MPISNNFTSTFIVNWDIYFSQCYPNGSLKIPELSNLLQLTASMHADLGGVGVADMSAYDQSWVMSRMRFEIDKMPVWSTEIQIKTWVEQLKGVKSIRNFELSHLGERYVGVSSLWVVMNTKTRRPDNLKLPTDHVEPFPDIHATMEMNRKLSIDFDILESFDYTVLFSDLDIVNHANNVKYLEWCLNYVDARLILTSKIRAIDLNFVKELNLGDKVEICKGSINNMIHFKIIRDSEVCFICEIELDKV